MRLLESGLAQAKAWYAAQALSSDSEAERKRAMQTLRELGAASLPSLHATIRRTGAPRAQFSAAVVLHWLGNPLGISVLLDGLKWQLPSEPQLARDLEACFIQIGSPDAPAALIPVWKQLLTTKDNKRVRKTICRVWAACKDPRVLTVLADTALEHAELFEETVPKFGEAALDMLAQMLLDPLPAKRSLAVRTARHIPSPDTTMLLFPLLRDPDHSVRALIPHTLVGLGRQYTGNLDIYTPMLNALEAGYSTPQAIAILLNRFPLPYDALLRLVLRWNGQQESSGDTLEAVLTALPALGNMPLYSMGARSELQQQLCGVLARRPEPALIVGIARILAMHGRGPEYTGAQTRTVLLSLLPHPDAEVRIQMGHTLAVFEDQVGKQMQQLVEAAWPQPNLRGKFQSLLRGGSDATQVANQAMQWFTKFSKDTMERWNAPHSGNGDSPVPVHDPRCPDLIRQLLDNSLSALHAGAGDQAETTRDLAIACIRALVRMDAPIARTARSQFVRALLSATLPVKLAPANAYGHGEPQLQDGSDDVRLAAGQALLSLYGADSFPLFVEAIHAPQLAVRLTGIAFLGELGEVRGLSLLQALAAQNDLLVSPAASAAIARIRQRNPETMTLLRASTLSDGRPETLLRPALGNIAPTPPDLLLRPAEHPAPSSQT